MKIVLVETELVKSRVSQNRITHLFKFPGHGYNIMSVWIIDVAILEYLDHIIVKFLRIFIISTVHFIFDSAQIHGFSDNCVIVM